MIEEISNAKINKEKFKELTGGGVIPVKENYQSMVNKPIYTSFIVACN